MEDWKYSQRWEMQEVFPSIFLGPYSAAKSKSTLQQAQITHILCIRDQQETSFIKPYFPTEFQYEILECKNSQFENLIPMFPAVSEMMDGVLNKGGRILVHCVGGISRAPCFVIAYLMERQGMTFDQAYTTVQNKRFCINPTEAFFGQMKVEEIDVGLRTDCSSAKIHDGSRSSEQREAI
jgi:serine/threonine/tyrosine-interacting protein